MTETTTRTAAVSAQGLTKHYREATVVSDLDLTLHAGQICALLGPNGAGKTSTMRMLLGLSRPDAGTVRILGEPVGLAADVLGRVGVAIDGPAFVPHLSGRRNLRLFWAAGGGVWPPPALDEALQLAGLGAAVDAKVKTYSMGMSQRLMLAQAVMGRPDVLILDEPANGLDPGEARALREFLRGAAADGAAVLISSHLLAEIQLLATHVVVMNKGVVLRTGSLTDVLGTAQSLEDAFLDLVGGSDAAQ